MTTETKTEAKTESHQSQVWGNYWKLRAEQDAKENEPRAVFWRKARNAVRVIAESSIVA
jgi:hypothetical protein